MNNSEILRQQQNSIKQFFQLNNFSRETPSQVNCLSYNKTERSLFDNISLQQMKDTQNIHRQIIQKNNIEQKQFQRKCTQQSTKHKTEIDKLQKQLSSRDQRIQSLQLKIIQLKQQQQYLLSAIQHLKDKTSTFPDTQLKLTQLFKIKQKQIQFLNREINKYKQWLKQQKNQVGRCLQCINLKDQIIAKLETEKDKLKLRVKTKYHNKNYDMREKFSIGEKDNEILKINSNAKQLRQYVFELVKQIENLRSQNSLMKLQLPKTTPKTIKREGSSLIHNQQHEDKKNWEYSMRRDEERYKMLSRKAYKLQMEIQKLMTQIFYLKERNYQKYNDVKREFSLRTINPSVQFVN